MAGSAAPATGSYGANTIHFEPGMSTWKKFWFIMSAGIPSTVSPWAFYASCLLAGGVLILFAIAFIVLQPDTLQTALKLICCEYCFPQSRGYKSCLGYDRVSKALNGYAEFLEPKRQKARERLNRLHNDNGILVKNAQGHLRQVEIRDEQEAATIANNDNHTLAHTSVEAKTFGLDAVFLLHFSTLEILVVLWVSGCMTLPLGFMNFFSPKDGKHANLLVKNTPIAIASSQGTQSQNSQLNWLLKIAPRGTTVPRLLWLYPVTVIITNLAICICIYKFYGKVIHDRNKYFSDTTVDKDLQENKSSREKINVAQEATRWVLVSGFTEADRTTAGGNGDERTEADKEPIDNPVTCFVSFFLWLLSWLSHFWAQSARRGICENEILAQVVTLPELGDVPDMIKKHNTDIDRLENIVDKVFLKTGVNAVASFKDFNKPIKLLNDDKRRSCWLCCCGGKYYPKYLRAQKLETIEHIIPDGAHAAKESKAHREVAMHEVDKYMKALQAASRYDFQALDHYVPNLSYLRQKVDEGITLFENGEAPATGSQSRTHFSFVRYSDAVEANKAIKALTEPRDIFEVFQYVHRKTAIILAPTPQDIIWKHLGMEPNRRTFGVIVNWLVVAVFTLIFVFPNVVVSVYLSNMNTIGYLSSSFRSFEQTHPTVVSITQGILAPSVQNLFYLYLPEMLSSFRKSAGELTKSGRERDAMRKLYTFYVFNQLFIFSCFSALYSLMNSVHGYFTLGDRAVLKAGLYAFAPAVANGLRNSSTYWLTYLLQRNTSAALDVVPLDRIFWLIVSRYSVVANLFSPTALKTLRRAGPLDFPYIYNNYLFTLVVILCLTPFQPLSAPIGLIFLITNWWSTKYTIVRVRETKHESYGAFWVPCVNRVLLSVLLGNVSCALALLVVGDKENMLMWQLIVLGIGPLILTGFKIYCLMYFENSCKYYIPKETRANGADVEKDARVFRHRQGETTEHWLNRLLSFFCCCILTRANTIALPEVVSDTPKDRAARRKLMTPMITPYLLSKLGDLDLRSKEWKERLGEIPLAMDNKGYEDDVDALGDEHNRELMLKLLPQGDAGFEDAFFNVASTRAKGRWAPDTDVWVQNMRFLAQKLPHPERLTVVQLIKDKQLKGYLNSDALLDLARSHISDVHHVASSTKRGIKKGARFVGAQLLRAASRSRSHRRDSTSSSHSSIRTQLPPYEEREGELVPPYSLQPPDPTYQPSSRDSVHVQAPVDSEQYPATSPEDIDQGQEGSPYGGRDVESEMRERQGRSSQQSLDRGDRYPDRSDDEYTRGRRRERD